jgi:tRNA dimethylallyltransferase
MLPLDLLQKCWFLAGPTASGKSAVGIELARRMGDGPGAEILSLDSMSLYRGMDIGTAKPKAAERLSVSHHLLDLLEPHEEFSVSEYLAAAREACQNCVARARTPLFVGGTGLYLRALLRGLFQGPPADWAIRQSLERLAETEGNQAVHNELSRVDPALAQRLHPHDLRRVIRGIEVYLLVGKPLSELQRQQPLALEDRPRHVYWLEPPRDWLYERIDRRVDAMIEQGLVGEVARLLEGGKPISRTARQALGYREMIDHLEGRATLDEARALIKQRTRQFAKRQHTWFRNLVECQSVPISGEETPAEIARRIGDGLRH